MAFYECRVLGTEHRYPKLPLDTSELADVQSDRYETFEESTL